MKSVPPVVSALPSNLEKMYPVFQLQNMPALPATPSGSAVGPDGGVGVGVEFRRHPKVDPKAFVDAWLDDVAPDVVLTGIPPLGVGQANGAGVAEELDPAEVDAEGFEPQGVAQRIGGRAADQHAVPAKGEVRREREGARAAVQRVRFASGSRDKGDRRQGSEGEADGEGAEEASMSRRS